MSALLETSRLISGETDGFDGVLPPDDFSSGLET